MRQIRIFIARSDHPDLHPTRFADHVLVPRRIAGRRSSASHAHNAYRLVEPTLEITPCHGRTKDGGFVVKSSWPPNSKWPLALAKRPVPPVTSAVSWLSNTPGVSVGHRYPSKVPEISSPLAANQSKVPV